MHDLLSEWRSASHHSLQGGYAQEVSLDPTIPHDSPHCTPTGTLLKGPGDKIYVLSAYHCLAFMGKRFMYPWSTFSIIFDYKLPCNASYVEDVPRTFDRYLTVRCIALEGPRC